MRYPRNAKIFRGQLEAAPLVGVLFLIVIFLVLKSSLVFVPGIEIDLPTVADAAGVQGPSLVVTIDRRGDYYYASQIVPGAQKDDELKRLLQTDVKRFKEPVVLIVQADKAVPYEVLTRVSRLAREAGIARALLATRPPVYAPTNGVAPAQVSEPKGSGK